MLRSIFSSALFLLVFVTSPAFPAFSQFVSVSPANDNMHQAVRPTVKTEGDLVTIRIPYRSGSQQKYWLIISDKPLAKERQDFRSLIWEQKWKRNGMGSGIILMAPLGNPFDGPHGNPMNKEEKPEIHLILPRELAQRAYIYHDFPSLVLDGGYYYTVDIPSYMLKEESQ